MGIFKKLFGKKELIRNEKQEFNEQEEKHAKITNRTQVESTSKLNLFELYKNIQEGKSIENINMDSLPPAFKKMVEDVQHQRNNLKMFWDKMLPVLESMRDGKSILDLKEMPIKDKVDEIILVPSGEFENIGIMLKTSNSTLTYGMMEVAKGLSMKEVMKWSFQNLTGYIGKIKVKRIDGVYIIGGLKDSTSSLAFLNEAWDIIREKTSIKEEMLFSIPTNQHLFVSDNTFESFKKHVERIKYITKNEKDILSNRVFGLKKDNSIHVISHFARIPEENESNMPINLENIYPFLKPRKELMTKIMYNGKEFDIPKEYQSIAHQISFDDLSIIFGIDMESYYEWVQIKDISNLNSSLKKEDLLKKAYDNLYFKLGNKLNIEMINPFTGMLTNCMGLESSFILHDEVWKKISKKLSTDEIVFGIPNRDIFVFTSRDQEEEIFRINIKVKELYDNPKYLNKISRKLYYKRLNEEIKILKDNYD